MYEFMYVGVCVYLSIYLSIYVHTHTRALSLALSPPTHTWDGRGGDAFDAGVENEQVDGRCGQLVRECRDLL